MDLGLSGRRYLVTGGTSGLGRAVAEVLVAEGAQVVVASRSPTRVAEAAAQLGAHGEVADLTEPGVAETLVARCVERLGGLDGAFVSQGGPPHGPASTLSDADLTAGLEIAAIAPIRVIRAVAAVLGAGGSVVARKVRQHSLFQCLAFANV